MVPAWTAAACSLLGQQQHGLCLDSSGRDLGTLIRMQLGMACKTALQTLFVRLSVLGNVLCCAGPLQVC